MKNKESEGKMSGDDLTGLLNRSRTHQQQLMKNITCLIQINAALNLYVFYLAFSLSAP